ncbi:MAG: D-2-hydroxyacid dehydrogenase [Candidatus Aenigmarchaeota archaeon]|nr:D-2-hydroxyacid dehydrogenase [Candidatus Aenigmarchaeota archaeon]
MRILVCDPIGTEGKGMLKKAGFILDELIEGDDLSAIVGQYDGIIVRSKTKVTKDVLKNAKKLKAIARAGSGLDNVDVEEAKRLGIKVMNSPEALTNAVAELVVADMIALLRNLPKANKSMKDGKWLKKELVGRELRGKVVGIVGFGAIGKRVADLCAAFGARIIAYDVVKIPEEYIKNGVSQLPVDSVIKQSDIITLHVPLVNETRAMINKKTLGSMKKGAILINASRGEVVDEKALLEALKSGHLAGAALDVFEKEPPEASELVLLPNVLVSPHIGGQTEEAQNEASVIVAKKLIDALEQAKSHYSKL